MEKETQLRLKELLSNILQKTLPNRDEMKSFINKHLSNSLPIVSKPCGSYLITKAMYNEMSNKSNITLDDVKALAKFMPSTGYVTSNPFYLTLLLYTLTFLAVGDEDGANMSSRFYTVICCGYLKIKYMRICDEPVLTYTLQNLHGASIVRNGFMELIRKISDETLEKYKSGFLNEIDIYNYYRYIVDIRNKLNQSMRIIAREYYKNKENRAIQEKEEDVDNIFVNNLNVLNNLNMIEYLSRECQIVDSEVENIVMNLSTDIEFQQGIKDLMTYTLALYGTRENIKKTEMNSIVFKLRKTNKANEILNSIYENVSSLKRNNYIDKLLISMAVLILVTYSKQEIRMETQDDNGGE